jgi:hypothetical protein
MVANVAFKVADPGDVRDLRAIVSSAIRFYMSLSRRVRECL